MRTDIARRALLCVLGAASSLAQEIQLGKDFLQFDYQVKPASASRSLLGDATADLAGDNVVIHRTLSDAANQVYFGYDLVLDREKLSDPYRASFRALTHFRRMGEGAVSRAA